MKLSFLNSGKTLIWFTALFFFTSPVNAQYCTPVYSVGCSTGAMINDVIFPGEGSTIINDLNTACSTTPSSTPPGNVCWRDMTLSMSVTVYQGTNYFVSINDIPLALLVVNNIQAWIDFNNDGTFAASECVGGGALPNTGALTDFSFSIPVGAALGSHTMRIVISNDYVYPNLHPCPIAATDGYGEVHDYNVIILSGSGSCTAPVLTLGTSTSTTQVVNWTAVTGATGYECKLDTSLSAPTGSGTATTVTTLTATSLTPGTTYYEHVRTNCGSGSFSAWTTISFTTYPVVVDNTTVTDFNITTYPNPVKDALTIEIRSDLNGNSQILLIDVTGKLIKTSVVSSNKFNIDMSGLPSGIYLVRYIGARHTQTIKVNKQ